MSNTAKPHEHNLAAATAAAAAYPESALPFESTSSSELLAATHVFTIEIRSAPDAPWAELPRGLQGRTLALKAALVEVFRGSALVAGDVFSFDVEQRRLPEPTGDHPGLWSRLDPEIGARFLFMCRASESSTPASLMRDGACLRVVSGERAVDVHLAQGAEHVFRQALLDPRETDPALAAARALVAFTRERLAAAGEVFARYLVARVMPTLLRAPAPLVPDLVALLCTADATFGVRLEIVAALDAAAERGDADVVRPLATGYFALLSDPGASRLHHRLVDVSLYLLLFPGDARRFPVEKVFPDAAERARFRGALAPFTSQRAQKLAAWLSA